jgi:hypothetical protein
MAPTGFTRTTQAASTNPTTEVVVKDLGTTRFTRRMCHDPRPIALVDSLVTTVAGLRKTAFEPDAGPRPPF